MLGKYNIVPRRCIRIMAHDRIRNPESVLRGRLYFAHGYNIVFTDTIYIFIYFILSIYVFFFSKIYYYFRVNFGYFVMVI